MTNRTDRSNGVGAADEWIDSLLSSDLEWRTTVRRHPWLALGAAAGVGFLIGSRRGIRLLDDLGELAAAGLTAGLGAYLGTDLTDG